MANVHGYNNTLGLHGNIIKQTCVQHIRIFTASIHYTPPYLKKLPKCDRICEKGSYASIQFFNFKDM